MKKNMGSLDRAIRILAAAAIGILILTETISGVLAIVLGIFAVAFLLTSAVSTCPLYLPFNISTAKKKSQVPRQV